MNNQEKKENPKITAEKQKEKSAADPAFQHDPIIISGGGSMFLEFDGPEENHYSLDNEENPTRFSSEGELIITAVIVEIGVNRHSCAGVPSHGRCTVTIQGKRSGKSDSTIIVNGSDEAVVIEFNDKEYEKKPFAQNRKNFGHKDRTIKLLTIRDDDTGQTHTCTAVPPNGKCNIVIKDDHRF
jgi:hypothetical protein